MLGHPVNVNAYTFRRSRSVHLLGHGLATPEDLRFILGHVNIDITRYATSQTACSRLHQNEFYCHHLLT